MYKRGIQGEGKSKRVNIPLPTLEEQQEAMQQANEQVSWVKHGKGIGSKIMCAAGFKPGMGLGISLQGRAQPVSTDNNMSGTRRAGLGFNNKRGIRGDEEQIEYYTFSKPDRWNTMSFIKAAEDVKENEEDIDMSTMMIAEESKPQRPVKYVRTCSSYRIGDDEDYEDIYDTENEHKTEYEANDEIEDNVDEHHEYDHESDNLECHVIDSIFEQVNNVDSNACTAELAGLKSLAEQQVGVSSIKEWIGCTMSGNQEATIPAFNTRSGERKEEMQIEFEELIEEDVVYVLQALRLDGEECLAFYDNGATCNLILGELAERLRLKPVKNRKIALRGVGNKAVWSQYGMYEFLLGPTRDTGSNVHLYAQGMPEITGYINRIDLTQPISEVKDDLSMAECLTDEVLPCYIGGQAVSLLIGLKQTRLMPVMRFTLPTGLALFESQIPDIHGSHWCFGGPHQAVTYINKMAKTASYQETTCLLQEITNAYLKSPYLQISRYKELEEEESLPGIYVVRSDYQFLEVQNDDESCECLDINHGAGNYYQEEEVHVATASKKRLPLAKLRTYEDQDDLGQDIPIRCDDCASCPKCSSSAKARMISLQEQIEQEAIEKSVTLDLERRQVLVGLPFTRPPVEYLKGKHNNQSSNFGQVNKIFKSVCKSKDQKTKRSLLNAMNELVEAGFIMRLEDLPIEKKKIIQEAEFQHYMPWTVAEKPSSTSTPYRFAVDATITGLNEILAKGTNNMNKIPNILALNRCMKYVWSSDITKLYNQLRLDDQALPYGLFLFSDDLDPNKPADVYVMLSAWYGVSSTSNQATSAILMLSSRLHDQFPLVKGILEKYIFVDDTFPGSNDKAIREEQIRQTRECIAYGGFKLKYVVRSGEKPDPKFVDDKGRLRVLGYHWHPESDMMSSGFGEVNFNKKRKGAKKPNPFPVLTAEDVDKLTQPLRLTKRMVASKMAEIFDP